MVGVRLFVVTTMLGWQAGALAAQSATPAALVVGAINAAGGADALSRARALRWDGVATVHAGGRRVGIRGTWAILPPDSAVVATYDTTRGPTSMRRLIVSGKNGWTERAGVFDTMPRALLAAEHDEFYLYHLMRLVSLREPGTAIRGTPPDTLGQRGFQVTQPNRPPVMLYVNSAGRLAHLRVQITDATTGGQVWQDLWLSGTVESGGVKWPSTIRITMNGAPYFDLRIANFRVEPRLVDPYLAGPR